MRILSVVTLISPQGEYGGPVRVALNQARELIELGHSVIVCAATRGFDTPPAQMSGVPLRLFPARQVLPGSGFAGLAAPSLWCGVTRHVTEFDVCHIHAARDLVTLPAAAIARARNVPFVLQTHGMIDRSTKPLAVPLDLALTRPVLRGAGRILYLTPVERQGLIEVGGAGLPLVELPNGVPWADEHEPPAASEVLYLARLAERKRPALFAEVAAELSAEFPDASFALVGPDEGEGDNVRRVIAASPAGERLTWEGPIPPEGTLDRMRRASVYVLPSVDEPYPMSVLEAMSIGLPVVITDSCGLAGIVERADAGIVVGPSRGSLQQAIRDLLADPDEARRKGLRGRAFVRDELAMSTIAGNLADLYRTVVAERG